MKYTEKLDLILSTLAEELNISDTMYDRAVQSYSTLGDYLKKANKDWVVEVYPQGSFEMGTVVKPISDDDQYDVDLIVLIKTPTFEAKILREKITALLEHYEKYEGKIEDKKRCIRIQYSDSAQFHMDIACAKNNSIQNESLIFLSQHDNNDNYDFSLSDPSGYITWFKDSMRYSELPEIRALYEMAHSSTDVKPLPLVKIHTPLQQAIQLLKRHRDIFFESNPEKSPSSIIITTLCALSYDYVVKNRMQSKSIYSTIKAMLENFNRFIIVENGNYHLNNPVLNGENFLENWKIDNSLKQHFDSWIQKATRDIITDPANFIENEPAKLRKALNENFGDIVSTRALKKYGHTIGVLNEVGAIKIDTTTMSSTLQQSGENISNPQKNTFFGDTL